MAQLTEISISNYRSVEYVVFECRPLQDGSATYALIGLNEAGKSNILRAIGLFDGSQPTKRDFRVKTEPIQVEFVYQLDQTEESSIKTLFESQPSAVSGAHFPQVVRLNLSIEPNLERSFHVARRLIGRDDEWDYARVSELPREILHTPIVWTADANYLISRAIDLDSFASDPAGVSVPLRNCFRLAGIQDIAQRVADIQGDSTEIEHLHSQLGAAVTEHIRKAWPNHPVTISFLVSNNQINFHVKDEGASARAKTADQRSDGFKQFISFLLTVSAENKNEELRNAILLLDEPETHLHPLAQEYLLEELITISKKGRGNMVLFATHSNYLIDKQDLSRNFRVQKKVEETTISQFKDGTSTYASVSYEVFGVMSIDYHTELYGRLHEKFQDEDPADEKRGRISRFDEEVLVQVGKLKKVKPLRGEQNAATLPTYIRNCIHHPDNGDKFTQAELGSSIEILKKLL